jgi:hypothetical protein
MVRDWSLQGHPNSGKPIHCTDLHSSPGGKGDAIAPLNCHKTQLLLLVHLVPLLGLLLNGV